MTSTFPFTVGVPPVQIPHLGLGCHSSHASLSLWFRSCQRAATPLGSHRHCPPTMGDWGNPATVFPMPFFLVCVAWIKALDGRTSWLIFWWFVQGTGLPRASNQNRHHTRGVAHPIMYVRCRDVCLSDRSSGTPEANGQQRVSGRPKGHLIHQLPNSFTAEPHQTGSAERACALTSPPTPHPATPGGSRSSGEQSL